MESILNSKLRLKAQQVCAVGNAHIKVFPNTNKGSIHDNLLKLKQDLAMVVVKGLSKVNRAVISIDEKNSEEFKLFVEGEGLREVMGTKGK